MARSYSPEFKANIIARMLPPNNVSVPDLARETQIPKDTLYCWRQQARKRAEAGAAPVLANGELSGEEKFAVVVETAHLNEAELNEYCRRQGLYPQQIEAWRQSCLQANSTVSLKRERAQVREQKQKIQALEKELARKEKALAEAAALLVLEKKVQTILAVGAGARSTSSNDAR